MSKWPSDPSERAKALHKAGKLGGSQFGRMGGRPARPRSANQAVANAANDSADEIAKVIAEQLRKGGSTARLRAAQMLLQAERDEDKAEREWLDMDAKQMSREQLIGAIAHMAFQGGPVGDHMRAELAKAGVPIEGTGTELPSEDN